MTVHHTGLAELNQHASRDRIIALPADVPWLPNYVHAKISMPFPALAVAKGQEPGGNLISHEARQLEGIALSTADDAVVRAKECRHYVQHRSYLIRTGNLFQCVDYGEE